MKEKLKVGTTIYNEQARWFEFDYHPQVIEKVNKDTVEVFEEGDFPNGKRYTVPIKNLREMQNGNEVWIIH